MCSWVSYCYYGTFQPSLHPVDLIKLPTALHIPDQLDFHTYLGLPHGYSYSLQCTESGNALQGFILFCLCTHPISSLILILTQTLNKQDVYILLQAMGLDKWADFTLSM